MSAQESPHCRYFSTRQCVSCTLLDRPASEGRALKQERLENLLRDSIKSVASIAPIQVLDSVFPSRFKLKMAVAGTIKDAVIGYVNDSREVIELLDCPLHPPRLNALLRLIREKIIPSAKLLPYHIEERRGELKWVLIMSNHDLSEVIVRFVLRSSESVPRIKKTLPILTQEFPEVAVVSANIQPLPSSTIEGAEEIVLTERHSITERYPTASVYIKPQSFMQVTYEAASALYKAAADWASGRKFEFALDLYCGSGAFLFSLASKVTKGIGVEVSEAAVSCANEARGLNAAMHLDFVASPVEAFLEKNPGLAPDLVIVNPPRRGLSEEVINQIMRLAPNDIVYSSCNPETLSADLKRLASHYEATAVHPFEMFPLTEHLEALTFLRRRY